MKKNFILCYSPELLKGRLGFSHTTTLGTEKRGIRRRSLKVYSDFSCPLARYRGTYPDVPCDHWRGVSR